MPCYYSDGKLAGYGKDACILNHLTWVDSGIGGLHPEPPFCVINDRIDPRIKTPKDCEEQGGTWIGPKSEEKKSLADKGRKRKKTKKSMGTMTKTIREAKSGKTVAGRGKKGRRG